MARRKSPREKKALAYRKDHVSGAEYPQAFQRYWPLKEARANRKHRRQVRQIIGRAARPEFAEERADLPLQPVRRDIVRKWGVTPLGEWVQDRLRTRIRRTCWNYFKNPYDPERDRQRFAAFLNTLVMGRTPYSRELALFLNELLNPPELEPEPLYAYPLPREQLRAWLAAFFRDEPEWELRLRAWIAEWNARAPARSRSGR